MIQKTLDTVIENVNLRRPRDLKRRTSASLRFILKPLS